MNKSYNELKKIKTFKDRYLYLKESGIVGETTFGGKRQLNQILYKSPEWKKVRDKVIIRDNGCDLGIEDRPINCTKEKYRNKDKILVHHINPITPEDILNRDPKVFDLNNLICVSYRTHKAIHYGDENLLTEDSIIERTENDTSPWRN